MSMRRFHVGGNWKMNLNRAGAIALAEAVVDGVSEIDAKDVDVSLFVPFPYLLTVGSIIESRGSRVRLGAQDVYHEPDGAFTGEVSLEMLRDCSVCVVLTGHSERRHVIGESDELVGKKTAAVLAAGFECVLCVGETLEERERGSTDAVNRRQLSAGLAGVPADQMGRVTIAYEPVWAIGTGKTASPADAQAAHTAIRGVLGELYSEDVAQETRIQYGGSVKPGNARELFVQPDIDGGLIGGASLDADAFLDIIRGARER